MAGFTLIELIVVIVILGTLAATAMPKFINMRREARIAVLRGMEAATRSVIPMVQGMYMLNNTANKNSYRFFLPVRTSQGTVNVYVYAGLSLLQGGTPGSGIDGMGRMLNIDGCETGARLGQTTAYNHWWGTALNLDVFRCANGFTAIFSNTDVTDQPPPGATFTGYTAKNQTFLFFYPPGATLPIGQRMWTPDTPASFNASAGTRCYYQYQSYGGGVDNTPAQRANQKKFVGITYRAITDDC